MTLKEQNEVVGWIHLGLVAVLPVILFIAGGRIKRLSKLPVRVLAVVAVTWFVRLCFRDNIELPIVAAYAHAQGNETYDGTAISAYVAVFGWIEPLIVCSVIAVTVSVCRHIRTTTPAFSPSSLD